MTHVTLICPRCLPPPRFCFWILKSPSHSHIREEDCLSCPPFPMAGSLRTSILYPACELRTPDLRRNCQVDYLIHEYYEYSSRGATGLGVFFTMRAWDLPYISDGTSALQLNCTVVTLRCAFGTLLALTEIQWFNTILACVFCIRLYPYRGTKFQWRSRCTQKQWRRVEIYKSYKSNIL